MPNPLAASYHNHSTWSDGAASIAEMIDAARRQGLDEVGLSDHFVLHPEGHRYRWSMDPDRLGTYVAELQAAADAEPQLVRVGLEVDWFVGHGARLDAALGPFSFDYLIGSVHEVDGVSIDGSARVWKAMTPAERDDVHRRYWEAMRDLAEHGPFDIVAHIDLPKKFGFRPQRPPQREIDLALDAVEAADKAVELNTAGWHKPVREAYPAPDILAGCRRRGIPVLLSADAHRPEHLARDFERGVECLRAAGYDRVVRFRDRERREVRLG